MSSSLSDLERRIVELETPYRLIADAVAEGVCRALKEHGLPGQSPSQRPNDERPHVPLLPPRSPAAAVSLKEAGVLLGVSAKTVMREIDRGNLRALRLGRSWRIRVAEIHAYLQRLEAGSRRF